MKEETGEMDEMNSDERAEVQLAAILDRLDAVAMVIDGKPYTVREVRKALKSELDEKIKEHEREMR
jgi:hypothetical protein